jgi:Cu/Ag efflux protein CusF
MPPAYTIALIVAAAIIGAQAVTIIAVTRWARAASKSSEAAQKFVASAEVLVKQGNEMTEKVSEQYDALAQLYEPLLTANTGLTERVKKLEELRRE